MQLRSLKRVALALILLAILQLPTAFSSTGFREASALSSADVWQGDTISISSDGSVKPADAPIKRNGEVYVLTKDVVSTSTKFGIYIARSGITLDGNGHKISGPLGYGVYFLSGENIKISNLTVEGFTTGVFSTNGRRIVVSHCTFATKSMAIVLSGFQDSVIEKNVFVNTGIDGQRAVNRNNVVRDNVVNGKPLVIIENAANRVVRGVELGQLVIINSRNILVENVTVRRTMPGIGVYSSANVTVSKSRIEENGWAGINVMDSSGVNVVENVLVDNSYGVYLHSSSGVLIRGNTITAQEKGAGQTPTLSAGIRLYASANNRIIGNVVSGYWKGVEIGGEKSSGNVFYGNDFSNQENAVIEGKSANTWDDGLKGNYWSDYKGTDSNGDGVGDTPYVISEGNVDRYPLVRPARRPEVRVAVVSAYGGVKGAGVYPEGSSVTVSVDSVVIDCGNGTRRVFRGWVRDGSLVSRNQSYTFTVDKPAQIQASWDTEYEVRVLSDRGAVKGSGWYKAGSTVTVTVPQTSYEDQTSKYVFDGFSLDGEVVATSPTYTFTVNRPLTLTARWREEPKGSGVSPSSPAVGGPSLFLLAAAVLAIILLLIAAAMLRRKKERTPPPPPPPGL